MNSRFNAQNTKYSVVYCGTFCSTALNVLIGPNVYSIIYCESGTATLGSSIRKRALSAGGCAVYAANGNDIDFSVNFRGSVISFTGTAISELFAYYLNGDAFEVFTSRRGYASGLVAFAQPQASAEPPQADRSITLLEAHRALSGLFMSKNNEQSGGNVSVRSIREYIDSNTDKKITLDELSKFFFISRTQIYRLFMKEYGTAPMQYMLTKKIETAKNMLKDKNTKISEIANALCFTDAKHFTKTFKKLTGMLPSEYRKTLL